MDYDEDLLAAVIGHEVAHALARHSTEKLSLGLTITVIANLAVAFFNIYQRRQLENRYRSQGGGAPGAGLRGGGGGGFRGIPASFPGMQSQARKSFYTVCVLHVHAHWIPCSMCMNYISAI